MASSPNSRKESTGENSEQETRSTNELQQPIETGFPDSNQGELNDQDTTTQSELVSNSRYLNIDLTTTNDTATLTDNRSPSPISFENGTGSGSIHQKPHQELVLKVSQGSHVGIPIDGEHRQVTRARSVTTRGGRVIRNITNNHSVKYNIGSAHEKHPADFSNYSNMFRPDSIKKGEQHKPSLRRDGQKRRTSSYERSNSEGSDVPINGKKLSSQESTDSCRSVTSNTQLIPNPYNDINHRLSSIIWCPCFFFFCFGCNLPGFYFMNRSDTLCNNEDYDKARIYARVSTALYILGMILSLAFWSGIFAVILIYAI